MYSFGGTFSEDGKSCVTWTGDRLSLWDLEPDFTFRNSLLGRSAQTLCAAIRSDGKQLLAGRANNAILCNLPDGEIVGKAFPFQEHVSAVDFDPKDRFYLIGSRDRTSRLWQVGTHQPIGQPMEQEGRILDVAFSVDGESFLTSCDQGYLRQWRTPSVQSIVSLPQLEGIRLLNLTPDASHVIIVMRRLSASKDIIQVRNVSTGELLQEVDAEHSVSFAALSRDGKTFVTAGKDTTRLWNLANKLSFRSEQRLPKQLIKSLAISPDGKTIAVGLKNAVHLFDGQQLASIMAPLSLPDEVTFLRFSPDNKNLFAVAGGKNQIWDSATGLMISQFVSHPVAIVTAAFSNDGASVLMVDVLGHVSKYEVQSGECTAELLRERREARAIAFHPNGRTVLAVSTDGRAQLYDLATGRSLGAPRQHFGTIYSVSFSSNASHAATLLPSGSPDDTLRDTSVWKLPERLEGDPAHIRLWVAVATGMELDNEEVPSLHSPSTWRQKNIELQHVEATYGPLRFKHKAVQGR